MNVMTIFDSCVYGVEPNEVVREFTYESSVEIVGGVAGRIECPGCTGVPVPDEDRDNSDLECIECKDTGQVWVSV